MKKQFRATSRVRLVSKLVAAFFAASALSTVVAWGVVLTGLCASPRVRAPESGHVIPYNCHGMTVFISPLQDAMKTWLLPVFIVLVLAGLLAAAFAVVVHAQVQVDVKIDRAKS